MKCEASHFRMLGKNCRVHVTSFLFEGTIVKIFNTENTETQIKWQSVNITHYVTNVVCDFDHRSFKIFDMEMKAHYEEVKYMSRHATPYMYIYICLFLQYKGSV